MKIFVGIAGFLILLGFAFTRWHGTSPSPTPAPSAVLNLSAKPLNSLEKAGQLIFLEGVDQTEQKILAHLAEEEAELLSEDLACARCHGLSGRGGTWEGQIVPDIRAASLFMQGNKALKHAGTGYTEATLRQLLESGIDAEGHSVHKTMPRYSFNAAQWMSLFAYLKTMGSSREPGVEPGRIKIGILQNDETDPALAALEAAFFETLSQAVARINEHNVGRRIELVSVDDPNLERLDDFFILLGYQEKRSQFLQILETDSSLPIVWVHEDPRGEPQKRRRMSFALQATAYDQGRIATQFARKELDFKVISVSPETSEGLAWEHGARDESLALSDMIMVSCHYSPTAMDAEDFLSCLHMRNNRAFVFYGSEEELKQFREVLASELLETPVIAFGGLGEDPRYIRERAERYPSVYWTSADVLENQREKGDDELQTFFARSLWSRVPLSSDGEALLMAQLLDHIFHLMGPKVSRLEWLAQLEQLKSFSSPWAADLSFARNKKVGAAGARILVWDPKKKRIKEAKGWTPVLR